MIPTYLALAFPSLRLDVEYAKTLDFHPWRWSEYDWSQDAFNGYADVVQPVKQTVETGTGDCDDFAFVAASWGLAQGKDVAIGIVGIRRYGIPLMQHIVTEFDGTVIYSNGEQIYGSIEDYVESHEEYTWSRRRNISKDL